MIVRQRRLAAIRPPGSHRASAAALRVLEARGEAFTTEISRRPSRASGEASRVGGGSRCETDAERRRRGSSRCSRRRARSCAAARAERGRAASTAGCRRRRWLGGDLERLEPGRAQAELLRRWLARVRPATETDIRWWAGWTAREARAALAAVPHAGVDLDGATGYVLADDLEPTRTPEPVGGPAADARPDDDGLEATRLVPRPARRPSSSTRTATPGPTVWWDGRVVGGWSQRDDGEIVFRLLEDVGADAVRRRGRGRARRRRGSATCASRRASCRRSSVSWRG